MFGHILPISRGNQTNSERLRFPRPLACFGNRKARYRLGTGLHSAVLLKRVGSLAPDQRALSLSFSFSLFLTLSLSLARSLFSEVTLSFVFPTLSLFSWGADSHESRDGLHREEATRSHAVSATQLIGQILGNICLKFHVERYLRCADFVKGGPKSQAKRY